MGYFSVAGGTFGSLEDPVVTWNGQDVYGVQGNTLIYGPFSSYTLSWAVMTDAAYTELLTRIDALAGLRVAVTLPTYSSTAWSSLYANLQIGGAQREGTYVFGVSVTASRVSTTA